MEYLDYLDYLHGNVPRRRNVQDLNPFDVLTEEDFQNRFRFSKQSTRELIRILSPWIEPVDPRAPHGIPAWKQVLIALRFFATGMYHRETGDLLQMSKSSVCVIVHRVARLICEKMRAEYVKFPTGNYAIETKTKFFNKYGFPGVLSVVDGSHVPILCPSTPDKEEYRNRKGYYSINVMGATGADLEFTNIVARWKGSTHDSRVIKNSKLYARFERNELDGLLLGDSGYQCNRFLITPLARPNTPAERRFQRSLKRTRSSVERMFGAWKNRFRCIHTEHMLRFEPRRCCIIITACAVLHNFGIRQREWEDQLPSGSDSSEEDDEEEHDPNGHNHDLQEGVRSRNDIIVRHFTN